MKRIKFDSDLFLRYIFAFGFSGLATLAVVKYLPCLIALLK